MERREILKINNLSIAFQKPASLERLKAVDSIHFHLNEGLFVALVGESGSGKSVTALSITRLLQGALVSGEILFRVDKAFVNTQTISEKELLKFRGKEIAYVFQDPFSSLNPVLTVGRQIEEVYRFHLGGSASEARNKTLKALSAVQLKDVERVYKSYAHELSGGMRQRVLIAMALVGKPKLLIADEPTTALDTEVGMEILKLLEDLRQKTGLTVLWITHDLPLAEKFSDEIYVMEKGRVIERLSREKNFEAQQIYTKKLFRAQLIGVQPKTRIEI